MKTLIVALLLIATSLTAQTVYQYNAQHAIRVTGSFSSAVAAYEALQPTQQDTANIIPAGTFDSYSGFKWWSYVILFSPATSDPECPTDAANIGSPQSFLGTNLCGSDITGWNVREYGSRATAEAAFASLYGLQQTSAYLLAPPVVDLAGNRRWLVVSMNNLAVHCY